MALYTNLPVYKSTYALMRDVTLMMPDMSRDYRYSIGQDLRQKVMDMIILIYRANRMRNKVPVIMKLRETLLEAEVYTRLMCDLKQISEGRYLRLAEQTTSISKQLAAWEKSEREKQSDGTARGNIVG